MAEIHCNAAAEMSASPRVLWHSPQTAARMYLSRMARRGDGERGEGADYSGCTSPGSFLGLGLGQTLNSVRAKT